MPDHLHALISFPPNERMSAVIGDWKRYQERMCDVLWQKGYFDHRIRNDSEFDEKAAYIRHNPAVKSFCERAKDWPWVWPSV
jgi:putative transposase